MKNATRQAYHAFVQNLATLNGANISSVDNASFSVSPSVQQTLIDRVQESSAFLNQVNMVLVEEQAGQKLGLGVDSSIASRTDTSGNNRQQVRDPSDFESEDYHCYQTNFNTALRYAKLDMWAKFPDFQTRWRNHVLQQIARDKLKIGWHGTSAAATTDASSKPNLEDVNIGWLKKIRDYKEGEQVVSGMKLGEDAPASEGWNNLDVAVFDAAQETIDEQHRDSADLVVICGRKLLTDKFIALLTSNDKPTENNATDLMLSNKSAGGYRVALASFFPSNAFLVTSFKNLSIYAQEGKNRRAIINQPDQDRVADYQSGNYAYMVEDYTKCALVDGILTKQADGSWQ